jgi:very-short-patch-repair endonuclease
MSMGSPSDPRTPSPPLEKGRSAREASRVGIKSSTRFDRTRFKTARARQLRQNSTDVEAKMWSRLRAGQLDGLSFRRQHPAGPYTLDFYCPQLRLAIELDGGQHNEPPQQNRDQRRSDWLGSRGVTVLRFWNNDVTKNLRGCLELIKATADDLRARGTTPIESWSTERAAAFDPHPALARRPPPFRGR